MHPSQQVQVAGLCIKQIIATRRINVSDQHKDFGVAVIARNNLRIPPPEILVHQLLDFRQTGIKPTRTIPRARVRYAGKLVAVLVGNWSADIIAFDTEYGFADNLHRLQVDFVNLAIPILVARRDGHVRLI